MKRRLKTKAANFPQNQKLSKKVTLKLEKLFSTETPQNQVWDQTNPVSRTVPKTLKGRLFCRNLFLQLEFEQGTLK